MPLTTYSCLKDLSKNLEVIKNSWDRYFYGICCSVAANSKCLSRQVGAILVRDKSIISTGYNGPPRGVRHCGQDKSKPECPRRAQGFKSGEGLHLCPANHAEENCIANAALNGHCTDGSTMYMTCGIPCKACLGLLINSGVSKLVVTSFALYDELSRAIIGDVELDVRKFI